MAHGAPNVKISKDDEKFIGVIEAFFSPTWGSNPVAASESRDSEGNGPAIIPGSGSPAASGSSDPVSTSDGPAGASESNEPAATSQPATLSRGSDRPAVQFGPYRKKLQTLFTSLPDWTNEPLSFFHENKLNVSKDLLDSIDKYVGGLLQSTRDFDSVRLRILQMTYYRVKDEILAKQRLRGNEAKENLINTLQQGGLNARTPNHKPLQWVTRGQRLAEICKDMGHKRQTDYCYTANLFLLDDKTDTELYRLPLNGERRGQFISSIQNRIRLSVEEKEKLEIFSENVMGAIWSLFQQSIRQNVVFVQCQNIAQNASPSRANMTNSPLNRLNDTNVLDEEAGMTEVGDNADHTDDQAHMMDAADNNEDNGMAGVTVVTNIRAGTIPSCHQPRHEVSSASTSHAEISKSTRYPATVEPIDTEPTKRRKQWSPSRLSKRCRLSLPSSSQEGDYFEISNRSSTNFEKGKQSLLNAARKDFESHHFTSVALQQSLPGNQPSGDPNDTSHNDDAYFPTTSSPDIEMELALNDDAFDALSRPPNPDPPLSTDWGQQYGWEIDDMLQQGQSTNNPDPPLSTDWGQQYGWEIDDMLQQGQLPNDPDPPRSTDWWQQYGWEIDDMLQQGQLPNDPDPPRSTDWWQQYGWEIDDMLQQGQLPNDPGPPRSTDWWHDPTLNLKQQGLALGSPSSSPFFAPGQEAGTTISRNVLEAWYRWLFHPSLASGKTNSSWDLVNSHHVRGFSNAIHHNASYSQRVM
ncbi:hypothetical protein N7513_003475 [Penicillium frequentans]|nr:hypothetical protein N7513_003475 [Penicillium glabrum]